MLLLLTPVRNCQIGVGRSTMGTVLLWLILQWLDPTSNSPPGHSDGSEGFVDMKRQETKSLPLLPPSALASNRSLEPKRPIHHYQHIHALLRVIRNGLECKELVDDAIDRCGECVNIREEIEVCRVEAETSVDEESARWLKRGVQHLRRYFLLISFQSYLQDLRDISSPTITAGTTASNLHTSFDSLFPSTNSPALTVSTTTFSHHQTNTSESLLTGMSSCTSSSTAPTFTAWFNLHKEFETMMAEMDAPSSLLPVSQLQPGDGIALTSEVLQVVNGRKGAVLASRTILKFDHFPGCQKMALKDRVEGAPNFRSILASNHAVGTSFATAKVYGVAMPTRDAIYALLAHVNAHPAGSINLLWVSLREEPVLYLNGRPYVLRNFQDPLKNLETTGIERERVESMERRMKDDVLRELSQFHGRLLLHEELITPQGFSIVVCFLLPHVIDFVNEAHVGNDCS